MPQTDPRILLETAQAKNVAQIICEEIKQSSNSGSNQRRYKLAKRSQQQYNQISKWVAANKVCNSPWENASDYFIPLTEWIIDAVHARKMQVLFSQEPYMTAKGTETTDIPKQEGVTDFVDMVFREIVKLYDNVNFFLKQELILPFAVLKYDWVSDYDRMIT